MYEVVNRFIEKICCFDSGVLNVIVLYIVLCLLLSVAIGAVKIAVRVCSLLLQWIVVGLGHLIIRRDEKQYMKYNGTRLFAIKLVADTKFYYKWINHYVFNTDMIVTSGIENSILDRVLHISLERVVYITKRIFRYFFHFSVSRIVFFLFSSYVMYKEKIIGKLVSVINTIPLEDIDIGTFLDFGELVSLLCIGLYILLDMRHKANGYSELRQERFKDLVRLEEKLLLALDEMGYCLYKNTSLLCEMKYRILHDAAVELSGKECHLIDGKIEYEDAKRVAGNYSELFSGYDDLTRVFECIYELDEDYKKSSLKGTNIYLTDYNAMIKDVYMFWKPAEDGGEYTKGHNKRVSLSKGTMEKWFKGCFIERVHKGEEVVYLSENETLHRIREASNDLDSMLEMAFEFDMYLKKHSEKIRKRLWKIHRLARLRLF